MKKHSMLGKVLLNSTIILTLQAVAFADGYVLDNNHQPSLNNSIVQTLGKESECELLSNERAVLLSLNTQLMCEHETRRDTAAKLAATESPRVSNGQLYLQNGLKNSFLAHEVFINEKDQLSYNATANTDKTSLMNLNPRSIECSKMNSEDSKFPKSAHFICDGNKNYLMVVYKVENEDKIRILGRKKDDKEFKLLKEVKGKKLFPLITASQNGWSVYESYFGFAVSGESDKEGVYLAVINTDLGTITEYAHPFSLSAEPVLNHYGHSVLFTGHDQNIYKLVPDSDRDIVKGRALVWKNDEGLEVLEMGVTNYHSFVKLRGYGKDIYKFFSEEFYCEQEADSDIAYFEYLDTSKIKSLKSGNLGDRNIGTVALLIKDDGINPPQAYLRRWYIREDELFSIKTLDTIEIRAHAFKIIKDAFQQLEESNFDPQTICSLSMKFNEDIRKTMHQSIPVPYTNVVHKNFEFVKPFSMTIENKKDGVRIPVNVWPAEGASVSNPKPLIIHIHGGPDVYEDVQFSAIKQYLANQGYWVVCPETRGSDGYGKAHNKALVNSWGQNHIDDVIAVAEAFKLQDGIDSHAVFLMGSSFGGYSALRAATRPDVANYFNGFVSICGLGDVGKNIKEASIIQKSKEGEADYLSSWDRRIGFKSHENYSTNAENIQISPYYWVDNIMKPVLLIHGTNDTTVLPNQSTDFFYRAKHAGKKVHAVMIEEAEHEVGFYGYADLPLKFFNEILAEGFSRSLSTYAPHKVKDVKKFIDDTFEND